MKRLDVGHRIRAKPVVSLLHPRHVVQGELLRAARQRHTDPGRHELERVSVSRQDDSVDILLFRLAAQRAENVVGLVALALIDGDPKCLDQLPDALELRAQLRRRRRAVRLVFPKADMAEGRRGKIESDRAVRRLPILYAANERIHEAEDSADILASRADGEWLLDGVPCTMHEGMSVQQHED